MYLRCSAGALSWRWPRGALRVLLRVGAAGRDFRACVRTRGSGARLFLEGLRSLAPLYPGRERQDRQDHAEGQLAAPVPVRCFYSRHGQAALYVEASELGAPGVGEPHEEFGLEYDLELLPRGARFDDSQGKCANEYARITLRSPKRKCAQFLIHLPLGPSRLPAVHVGRDGPSLLHQRPR